MRSSPEPWLGLHVLMLVGNGDGEMQRPASAHACVENDMQRSILSFCSEKSPVGYTEVGDGTRERK